MGKGTGPIEKRKRISKRRASPDKEFKSAVRSRSKIERIQIGSLTKKNIFSVLLEAGYTLNDFNDRDDESSLSYLFFSKTDSPDVCVFFPRKDLAKFLD